LHNKSFHGVGIGSNDYLKKLFVKHSLLNVNHTYPQLLVIMDDCDFKCDQKFIKDLLFGTLRHYETEMKFGETVLVNMLFQRQGFLFNLYRQVKKLGAPA